MIVEYDAKGMIMQVVFDPVPDGYDTFMKEKGKTFLNIQPKKLEEKIFVDFDEDGNARYAEQIEMPQIDIHAQYVDTNSNALTDRPVFDVPEKIVMTAGSNEKYIIDGLPSGTALTLDNETSEVVGGKLELIAGDAGIFSFVLNCWPYLPATVEVVSQ